ncbi:hypothetical protein DP43_5211 [Burkholderia pseudomallei]|nr:hypothetical protein DP43_5211 [Burkholderia pseudomallei]
MRLRCPSHVVRRRPRITARLSHAATMANDRDCHFAVSPFRPANGAPSRDAPCADTTGLRPRPPLARANSPADAASRAATPSALVVRRRVQQHDERGDADRQRDHAVEELGVGVEQQAANGLHHSRERNEHGDGREHDPIFAHHDDLLALCVRPPPMPEPRAGVVTRDRRSCLPSSLSV